MIKFLRRLLLFLLILAGLAYLLFPFVSDQRLQYIHAALIREYRHLCRNLTEAEKENLLLMARIYNGGLPNPIIRDMFPDYSGDVRGQNVLQVSGSGLIGVLEIPSLRAQLPIYPADAPDAMASGVILVPGASAPTGTGGHVVLAGESGHQAAGFPGEIGLQDGFLFKYLGSLQQGDLITLNVLNETWLYKVTGTETVSASRLNSTDWSLTGDRLTLISNPGNQRLLVRAERMTEQEAARAMADAEKVRNLPGWATVMLLGSPVLLIGLVVMGITEMVKKKRYQLPADAERS